MKKKLKCINRGIRDRNITISPVNRMQAAEQKVV